MKRRITSTLLSLTILLILIFSLGTPVSAASGTTGSCTWTISGNTLIISGNGPMADYSDTNLPPWVEIAPSITTIEVREGVTSIGDYAFAGCTSATAVLLPNYSLSRMGDAAFLMCTGITSFWIPPTVTDLGMSVFAACYQLGSLSVSAANPVYSSAGNCIMERASGKLVLGCRASRISENAGLRIIGEGAFMMVSQGGTADFTIPAGVTTIEAGAFAYAEGMVGLPSTLTELGESAFLGAEIPFLYFPEGLKTIPSYCCSESTVSFLQFPSTLTEIGDNAFSYCEKLNSITLPQNLKSIGNDAFWACSLIYEVTIPNSVQFIGISAFSANEELRGFTVADDHPYFKTAEKCLMEKASGKIISAAAGAKIPQDQGVLAIGDYAFAYSDITSVAIPKGVTSIGEGAFVGCAQNKIMYVRIPESVTSVGAYAFADCYLLSEITFCKKLPTFHSTAFENTPSQYRDIHIWFEGAPQDLSNTSLPVIGNALWHYAENSCDTTCSNCERLRYDPATAHRYESECDTDCDVCGDHRAVAGHSYDNACDPTCNKCGDSRTVPDHTYDNNCDTDCNTCGKTRITEDHVYDSVCDENCNLCGAIRTVTHSYVDACDSECDLCGKTRTAPHVYDDSEDLLCNECGYERPPYVPGDLDGKAGVDMDDAIYLLFAINFSDQYPTDQPLDFDGNGQVNMDDAIYLLFHVNFSEQYPLH
ncbi:MAG: hypothetical protein E7580_07200 [Ruminococcaceae bacterium]|nr:hypothetical protein [Oscillospiraceae bacterium]